MGGPRDSEESYVTVSEKLKEEAQNQLSAVPVDPKAKAKAAPKKGVKAAEPEPDNTPVGPELLVTIGEKLPEICLRLVDADKACVKEESGRKFRVSMFRERKAPVSAGEDPNEAEILRRPVNFGDKRETFVDPLDENPPSGKATPTPPADGEEQEELPATGDEFREGVIGGEGHALIGANETSDGSDDWLIPVHLQPGIYWIRIEDITDFQAGCPWKAAD